MEFVKRPQSLSNFTRHVCFFVKKIFTPFSYVKFDWFLILLLQIFASLLQVFALLFGTNCTEIDQSQSRYLSLYIIITITVFLEICYIIMPIILKNKFACINSILLNIHAVFHAPNISDP